MPPLKHRTVPLWEVLGYLPTASFILTEMRCTFQYPDCFKRFVFYIFTGRPRCQRMVKASVRKQRRRRPKCLAVTVPSPVFVATAKEQGASI